MNHKSVPAFVDEIKKLIYDNTLDIKYKVYKLDDEIFIMGYIANEPLLAFWIKNNKIYAANGTAKAYTRNKIDYTPGYAEVLKMVENNEYIK